MTTTAINEGKIKRILGAARSILAENGYAAATISQIAAKAGVSRGLLHYYFKNKEEMLISVARHNIDNILVTTRSIFAAAKSPEQLGIDLSKALRGILEGDPEFFQLVFESWTLARTGPEGASLLKDMHEKFRNEICLGLEDMAGRGAIEQVSDFQGLAAMLTGLVDGLGMQMTIDRDLATDDSVWEAANDAICRLVKY